MFIIVSVIYEYERFDVTRNIWEFFQIFSSLREFSM